MIEDAIYCTDGQPSTGNPLIDALPGELSDEDLIDCLTYFPPVFDRSVRAGSTAARRAALKDLDELYVPRPQAVQLYQDIHSALIEGYKRRNPLDLSTQKSGYTVKERMRARKARRKKLPPSILLSSISGMGKTEMSETTFSLFPTAIRHRKYLDIQVHFDQIVYVRVHVPVNSSLKGFILKIFMEIDRALGLNPSNGVRGAPRSYHEQYCSTKISIDSQIQNLAQVAATVNLGFLHIDDFQRLVRTNKARREELIQMVMQLADVVGVPLLITATPKAYELLAEYFELTRRFTSGGEISIEFAKKHTDGFFKTLLEALFKYQVFQEDLFLTPERAKAIFEMTLGIPAVVIALFTQAQRHALRRKNADRLEESDFTKAYSASLKALHLPLRAIRSGESAAIKRWEDVWSRHRHQYHAHMKDEDAQKQRA